MKQYLLSITVIALAISLSAFTKPATSAFFANHNFRFVGDPTVAAQVADKSNWIEATISCDGVDEVACSIIVDDHYTHSAFIGGGIFFEVLNAPGNTPAGESSITINTANGYLDTAPNPDVQYYIVATGVGYTPVNQSF